MGSETHITGRKKPRKSGSEMRQRQRRMTFRLSAEEYENLDAAARDAGLTLGSYIRAKTVGIAHTGARRRPSLELETIARLQGEMNRVGSNIHQILKRVNFGETPLAYEFEDALRGYREVIEAILAALGRRRAA
jgi:hypothetical protein